LFSQSAGRPSPGVITPVFLFSHFCPPWFFPPFPHRNPTCCLVPPPKPGKDLIAPPFFPPPHIALLVFFFFWNGRESFPNLRLLLVFSFFTFPLEFYATLFGNVSQEWDFRPDWFRIFFSIPSEACLSPMRRSVSRSEGRCSCQHGLLRGLF